MHDAPTLQTPHGVAAAHAHAPDLPIQPLRQHDAEGVLTDRGDLASPGYGVENRHAARHPLDKRLRDWTVDGDEALLPVTAPGAEGAVDDIAGIGQQDQALRILVQPAHRKYPGMVSHEVDDVFRHVTV